MPETMPSVAVRSRPNGLPIAIAGSPDAGRWRESANASGLTPRGALPGSMLHEREVARRVGADHLRRRCCARRAEARPRRGLLPPTTCALVTSVPLRSIRKPVPESAVGPDRDHGRAGLGVDLAGHGLALVGRDGLAGDRGQRLDVRIVVQQGAGGEGAARDRGRHERHRGDRPQPDGAGRRAGRFAGGGAFALSRGVRRSAARRLLLRSLASLLGLQAPLARPQMPGKLHRHGE